MPNAGVVAGGKRFFCARLIVSCNKVIPKQVWAWSQEMVTSLDPNDIYDKELSNGLVVI